MKKINKTDSEWKKILTPEQYRVLRGKGTEKPHSGRLLHNAEKGVYVCAGCGLRLFPSASKYDSGTGWPSFFAPVSEQCIEKRKDTILGRERTEIVCSRCGGHLGHVFRDGPEPTGERYCVNSLSLGFRGLAREKMQKSRGSGMKTPPDTP